MNDVIVIREGFCKDLENGKRLPLGWIIMGVLLQLLIG